MNPIKYFKEATLSQKIFYLIMIVFGCIFYTTAIGNHYYFRTYAFDYAVYNFAFWDYAHFHCNNVTLYRIFISWNETFMQDHFSLTLMYLVPLFWLLNWLTGTYTLLIILVSFILWSGWAIYKLVKLKTNDDWLAAASVLYYFLLQGRYSAFAADSNILTIICCIVPLLLLYFEMKRYVIAFILFILLLFSREDMPLWFIFIFMVLAVWHWKDRKIILLCVAGIVISILYFVVLFKVFIPMTEVHEHPYALFQYSSLGKTPMEALLNIFRHPVDTFKLLYVNQTADATYAGVKKEFYMVYLISGGFLLFLRPQYFIWFIPLIAQKMFNDDPARWGIKLYYSIPIVTLLPISVFIIISIFKIKWIRYSLAAIVCILTLSVTWNKMNVNNRALTWGSTTKENVFAADFFKPGYDASKINEALKLVPPEAKVSASESIVSHLSQRKYIYEFPDVEDADYIAVFKYHNFYATSDSNYSKVLNGYITNPSWKVIADVPPFVLIKKEH